MFRAVSGSTELFLGLTIPPPRRHFDCIMFGVIHYFAVVKVFYVLLPLLVMMMMRRMTCNEADVGVIVGCRTWCTVHCY